MPVQALRAVRLSDYALTAFTAQEVGQKDYVNKKFHWYNRVSNLRPSGLQRSAPAECTTACPIMNKNKNSECNLLYRDFFNKQSKKKNHIESPQRMLRLPASYDMTSWNRVITNFYGRTMVPPFRFRPLTANNWVRQRCQSIWDLW